MAVARTAIGKPYQWGATGPSAFDCSGLVYWSYAQVGITVPRTSQAQATGGQLVSRNQLLPGDVIIYYPDASHCGLYSGDGNVIHASTYGVPVAEVPVDRAGPFNTARRYLDRSAMTVTGLDYAGGRPAAAHIKAAGYGFVCRYLSDGGSGLPGKLLLAAEVADLQANGVDIVSNWETTGTTALNGFNAGVSDAKAAWAVHTSLGGPTDRPIYFSLDWDEAPAQDSTVDSYFQGVASVIGLQQTGAYGSYFILQRLLSAGLVTFAWQTQAWSGGNTDPRFHILQDNNAGYINIDGVQCDLDYALTDDFGQWSHQPNEWNDNMSPTPQDVLNMFNGTNADGAPFIGPDGADYRRVDLLSPDTEPLGEDPNTTRSIFDQITTLSKLLSRTHDGKTLFQMVADLHDKLTS